MIELAIILPVLLMLVLGVVDFARAIQFNNILVAMSREGANLASRTTETSQNIIRALNNTAEPVSMSTHGMVYITKIIGKKIDSGCNRDCETYPKVETQTRAITGDATLRSQVWPTCPTSFSANDGSCINPSAWKDPNETTAAKAKLPTLSDGEVIYAVETLYDYTVIVTYVMKTGPKLYSLTVL